jgi:hypothetical protein
MQEKCTMIGELLCGRWHGPHVVSSGSQVARPNFNFHPAIRIDFRVDTKLECEVTIS